MSCGPMPKKMYTDVSSSGLRRCIVYGWHKHKSLGVFAQCAGFVRSIDGCLVLCSTTPLTKAARRSTHLFSLWTGSEGGSLSSAVYSSDSDNNCPPCNELEKQHQFWDQWACKCFPIAKSPHWCDSPFSFRILLPAAASNQYSTEHR